MADLPAAAPALTGSGVSARRICFVDSPQGDLPVVAKFTAPREQFAVAETIAPDALPHADIPADSLGEMLLLEVAVGAGASFDWQKRAEEWMAKPMAGGRAAIEIVVQSVRALWRPGRAAVIGGTEAARELIPGLIEFAFYEGELRRLEQKIEGYWPGAERDAALTHQVGPKEVARWPQVSTITREVALIRQRFVRLEPVLVKASLDLPPPARRLVSELLVLADVIDRLRFADDKIEVLEDTYELANDRISEFKYFNIERKLELWIIAALLLDVAVYFWEYFFD